MTDKGRIKNRWARFLKLTVIWSISAVAFFCFFNMSRRNSSRRAIAHSHRPNLTSSYSNSEQRSILYAKMAKDLDEKGALFLKRGETSQSLSLSDLFTLRDGKVIPVLKAADPPVRASVLHLTPQFSVPISEAVKSTFLPYLDQAIWFQDPSMYHFSMFHASHHIAPVPVMQAELEDEIGAVRAVADGICPMHIVLNRVVLTSTGVLLGCWQVVSGVDPITIRTKLKAALPRAPQKQLYDEAILHTSFARLLGPPEKLTEEENTMSEIDILHDLVEKLNRKIRGVKATVSELWFVEEYDLLALALNGKMKIRRVIESKSAVDDQQWLTCWVLYSMIFVCSRGRHMFTSTLTGHTSLSVTKPLTYGMFRKKKDVLSKPDDIITAAENYIQENGPDHLKY